MELKDIKNELQKRIDNHYEDLAFLLQTKRAYKKDGSDFKNLSQSYPERTLSPKFSVWKTNNIIWVELSGTYASPKENKKAYRKITLYNNDKYTENEPYTAELISKLIDKTISNEKELINGYHKQLKDADKVFKKVSGLVTRLCAQMKELPLKDGYSKNSLGYLMESYLSEAVKNW